MKLSVTDIAFEGFRVVRDRPLALIAWVVLQFGALMALQPAVLMARNAYDLLAKLGLMPTPANPQPAAPANLTPAQADQIAALTGDLFGGVALSVLVTLVVSSLLDPGVYRVAITPRDRGFLSLRLGLQEGRQFLVLAILFALFFGIYLCGNLATLLFTGVFAVAGQAGAILGLAAGFTGLVCALAYFSIRLSLAGPMSFDQKRIDVFGSWTLTRGRFYGLLGGYALALALGVLVELLSEFIFQAILTVAVGDPDKVKSPFDAVAPKLSDLYTPAAILRDAGAAVAGALFSVILVGARAQAYLQIRKGGTAA